MPTKIDYDPYGKPGVGNYDEAWHSFLRVPCATCGADSKEMRIKDNKLTIRCVSQAPFTRGELYQCYETYQKGE